MANEFNRIMRAFVVGQVILCALAGVVVGVGLAALRVQYPFVMGVLAGVTRAIPIIGPIIGGIPIVALDPGDERAGDRAGRIGLLHVSALRRKQVHHAAADRRPHGTASRRDYRGADCGGEIGGLLIGGTIGSLLGMFFAAPLASIARVMVRRYWLGLRHTTRSLPNGASWRFGDPAGHDAYGELCRTVPAHEVRD